MNAEQKKEIEVKWQQLLARADKSRKAKTPAKPTGVFVGAKVIRRRKGRQDLPIA
jgi:hypothetical protein